MIDISQIYQGWKNLVFKTPEIEKEAKRRLNICGECSIRTEGKCDKSKGGCGCPLAAKARSPQSKCPKDKW